MKYLGITMVFLLALTFAAGCASTGGAKAGDDFTGRWEGSFEAEGFGTLPVGLNLKANGSELTGSYDGMNGPEPIKNGKIEGKNISFDVALPMMGGEKVDFKFKGVNSGKTMELSWTSKMGNNNAIVTRKDKK